MVTQSTLGGRFDGPDVLEVDVMTADSYFDASSCDTTRIQCVKIDVAGAEARVVGGMIRTLERMAYPPIWCEVWGASSAGLGCAETYRPVADRLAPLGYSAFFVEGDRDVPVTHVRGRVDVLFRRTSA